VPDDRHPADYRAAYQHVLRERGPLSESELLAWLAANGHGRYDLNGLKRFLDGDSKVVRTDGLVSLHPVRSCGPAIEARLVQRLARSAAPMVPGALVRWWRADDKVLGNWIPDSAVFEVIEKMSSRGGLVVFDDGRVGLTWRGVLPDVEPWTDTGLPFGMAAAKFVPGVSQWHGEWDLLAPSVMITVAPPAFRSMSIHAMDHSGRAALVTSTVVDLGETVALVTTATMTLARSGIDALERRHWWFWKADSPNPICDVQGRRSAPELTPGEPFRGVHVTRYSRGAGDAVVLALRAAQLGKEMTLTVALDFGPETPGDSGASGWARAPVEEHDSYGCARGPLGPTLAYCGRCRRSLSDPESASRGYGACCWKKLSPAEQEQATGRVLHSQPGGTVSNWAYPLTVDEWLVLNPPGVSGDPLV